MLLQSGGKIVNNSRQSISEEHTSVAKFGETRLYTVVRRRCVSGCRERTWETTTRFWVRRRSELGSSCGGEEKEHMNGAPAGVAQGLGDEPCGVKAGSVFCCGAEWVGFPAQRWGAFEEEERAGQRFSLFF